MGVRMATILFADIVGCSEVSNELGPTEYDTFVSEFQQIGMDAQELLFPKGEYDDTKFELTVRGDEVCLILHTTPEVTPGSTGEGELNQQKRREEAEKAFLFAMSLKLLWLVGSYNQRRLENGQLPRDIGVGIHHGLVVFQPHPQTVRTNTSEGFAINLAKRIEGVSRLGTASRVFVSKEVRHLLRESSLELEFDEGRTYELKGITTSPHLHEVVEIGNSTPVFETAVMQTLSETAGNVIEAYYAAARVHDEDFWLRKLVGYVMIAKKDRRAPELLNKDDVVGNYFEQGNALTALGQYDEAIRCYQEAVKVKRDMQQAWNNMGIACDHKGDYDEAIRCFSRAVEIKPDYHKAWNNIGGANHHKGDYDEAIRCYQEAVKVKPDYHEAWYNMGLAYAHKGDYDQAIRCYQKAVDLEPDSHEPWYNMACAYALKKDATQAVEWLRKAIELHPEYRERARSDKDFDSIRDDPEFRAFLG